MRVKEVAEILGVPSDTIRYYTRIGVAAPERDTSNGYRIFGRQDITNLRFCIRARNLGFSLEEIQEILGEVRHGHTACPRVREIINERLAEIETNFAETRKLYERIKRAAAAWETMPDKEPTSTMVCNLVENWDRDSETNPPTRSE